MKVTKQFISVFSQNKNKGNIHSINQESIASDQTSGRGFDDRVDQDDTRANMNLNINLDTKSLHFEIEHAIDDLFVRRKNHVDNDDTKD
jgi:hypothetical protein